MKRNEDLFDMVTPVVEHIKTTGYNVGETIRYSEDYCEEEWEHTVVFFKGDGWDIALSLDATAEYVRNHTASKDFVAVNGRITDVEAVWTDSETQEEYIVMDEEILDKFIIMLQESLWIE